MQRTVTSRDRARRRRHPRTYRPRLELLEVRLPPGDAVLAGLLARALVGPSVAVLGSGAPVPGHAGGRARLPDDRAANPGPLFARAGNHSVFTAALSPASHLLRGNHREPQQSQA